MSSYDLQFVLSAYNLSIDILKNTLREFGDGLKVVELARDPLRDYSDFKVYISTLEPTLVFDACSQLGRIKSAKIDEKKPGL